MSQDLFFYALAIPAVIITGLGKGGFGAGMGMLSVPVMSLAVSPVRAAAILLPLLLLMDAFSLYFYRGKVKWSIVRMMMPGAIAGTMLGWASAAIVSADAIKLLVGIIAVVFALYQALGDYVKRDASRENIMLATLWGALAGYASFVSHAGGPPYQAYALPLKIDKLHFAGSAVMFFAMINTAKIIPYMALGQFSMENLFVSLTLVPIACIGVMAGVWLVNKASQSLFYTVTCIAMLVVGAKLIWDGALSLAA